MVHGPGVPPGVQLGVAVGVGVGLAQPPPVTLSASIANATPDTRRVNPSSARRLKKPPCLWATVLRNDLREGQRQDMERRKIVFFSL